MADPRPRQTPGAPLDSPPWSARQTLERIAVNIAEDPFREPLARLVAAAEARSRRYAEGRDHIPAWQGSNFRLAFATLRQIVAQDLATGRRFCEWGSGLGVVTCLAGSLGFAACGIEIEPLLVAAARQLAAEYRFDVRFVQGSYQPPGTVDETLRPAGLDAELGFSPLAFDVIYCYPWPAEQRLTFWLFTRFALPGTLLVTYHGGGDLRVFRQPGAG